MPAAPSSLTPAPWAADSLDHALSPSVTTAWTLTAYFADQVVPITAWDITVSIDARRIPIAELAFKMPVSEVPVNPVENYLAPWRDGVLVLRAGWQRAGGPDVHPIFTGTPTEYTVQDGIATVRAYSMDGVIDSPWDQADLAPTGLSSLAQAIGLINDALAAQPILYAIEGTLPTPTSGQLTAFRSMRLTAGTPIMETLTQMALALGHWVRGSLRATPTTRPWLTISARYDTGTPIDLSPYSTDARTVYSLDDWAYMVELTATWTEGGTTKTSRRLYVNDILAIVGWEYQAPAQVSVSYKPAGGTLTANDPVGKGYANAYAKRLWRTTATTRAIWWLQPRQMVTLNDTTGQIETLKFDVDAGLMTISTVPASAY